MIDQNTKYEGGMSDEQFGNLLAHLGRMEKENPMPKMETPRGGGGAVKKAIDPEDKSTGSMFKDYPNYKPNKTLYHGTDAKISSFEPKEGTRHVSMGASYKVETHGSFLSPTHAGAKEYGSNVYKVHADLRKPLVKQGEDGDSGWNSIPHARQEHIKESLRPLVGEHKDESTGITHKHIDLGMYRHQITDEKGNEKPNWPTHAISKEGLSWHALDHPGVATNMARLGYDHTHVFEPDDAAGKYSSVFVPHPHTTKLKPELVSEGGTPVKPIAKSMRIALRFSHGLSKAVRHEGAGQTEMNLVTGKTVRGGQFAPSPTADKTPAAKVAAAPATPLTPTQEKQVQTALTSGQAEIAKDGTKYALKVKPAGNTRFRAVGTFKTMREAKAAVLPALGVEGKGAKVTAYQDVGAKIGGARKDIASARTKFEDNPTEDGLTALEGEDPAAASRAVKKSVLWPISSVDDMKAKGADPDSIYVAHALHSLVSPKPEIDTADGRAHYFAGVATLRAFVEGSASFEALSERLRGLSADYRTASHAAYDEYRKTRGMRASYDEPCTLYQAEIGVQVAALGSRFHKFMDGKDTKIKGRDVYPPSLIRDGIGPVRFYTPERKWLMVHDAFGGGGETSTETVAGPKAKSVDDLDIAAERERLKQWERTAPTTYERKGGKVATIRRPEEYLKAFGLRGVEFGTYMDDEASRLHVDRCAEAFQDLADVLGISSKELSMNGRLALAFGARGVGGFAAHYEPHKVVINLTKLGGAGALAHEWTHFFDHTLQRVESGNANSMDYLSKAGITRGQELTDVQKAMVGVMEKIYHGGGHMKYLPTPKSTSGFAGTADHYLAQNGNDPQKALDAIFKSYTSTSLNKLKDIADYMAHKTGAKQIDLPTKGSEYHGRMLRAGEYWARPQEMFARCMEAYVQDALTSKKRMNNYLVRETKKDEDSPLPRGEQRKSINAAIGVLLQAVRDGGTLKKALGLAKAVETETRVPKGQNGGGRWTRTSNSGTVTYNHPNGATVTFDKTERSDPGVDVRSREGNLLGGAALHSQAHHRIDSRAALHYYERATLGATSVGLSPQLPEKRRHFLAVARQETALRVQRNTQGTSAALPGPEPPAKKLTKAQITAKIKSVEKALHLQRHETAFGMDENGKVVMHEQGDSDSVTLTAQNQADFASHSGIVFTHNHPDGWNHPADSPLRNGNSFSAEDIAVAMHHGFSEIRVVTPTYIYTMKPGANGWFRGTGSTSSAYGVSEFVQRVNDSTKALFKDRIRLDKWPHEQASAAHWHHIWSQVAPSLGWEYTRTILPDAMRQRSPQGVEVNKALVRIAKTMATGTRNIISIMRQAISGRTVHLDASFRHPIYTKGTDEKPGSGGGKSSKAVSPFDALEKGWSAFGGGSE